MSNFINKVFKMGNKNEKTAAAAAEEKKAETKGELNPDNSPMVTEENVTEKLLKDMTLTEDAVKKASEEIAKSKEEKKIAEAKAVILEVEWLNTREAITMRKSSAIKRINTERVKAITKLKDDILAGTVPYSDFKEKVKEIYKESMKKSNAVDRDFDKNLSMNDALYNSNDVYEWRRNISRRTDYYYE